MLTKLARIAEIAKTRAKEVFTSLYHHLYNVELLRLCHHELPANRATGVDGVTKTEYDDNLEENLRDLSARLARMGYRPQPVRRTYIPKDGGKSTRPLGIPSYEDKLVQVALTKLLESIYEQDFLPCSYGFRPGRNCHDALKELTQIIEKGRISYVVDADIRGFFNNVNHDWLMRCLEQRIGDPRIKRLIKRFLISGIMEDGEWRPSMEGTPQGGNISPLLANIYLHYVLDLWFEHIVKKQCRGEAEMVRYADDFVCCFQYKDDAERFYQSLQKRLAKFNLEIAEEKSKIISFGRFAEENSKREGKNRPDTFDFLGFTHYCGRSRKGKFRVKRRTSKKKFRAKVKKFKEWIRKVRATGTAEIIATVSRKLTGHYNYYGITDNISMLSQYYYNILMLLHKWLNRRSQMKSFNYEEFYRYLKYNPLPTPKIKVSIYG